ncbi:MAG TPA: helix-turn-helix transcriptional regulator [Bacillota bacterium]|nr:helix-turn-helix transcriptional regulator [Bacillota bacterium]
MRPLNYRLLGEKIKKMRLNKGLTQEALAEQTNLSAPYIGQIERGERKLSVETLVQIGNSLGASFDYLLQSDPRPKHDAALDELLAAFKGRTNSEIKMIIDVGKTILKHCKNK